MASAVIGALRVNLGIDSAQFTTGLKKAQSKLGKFGLLIPSLIGAGVAAFAGLSLAIKSAVNEADAMDEAAQKFGMTTEELTKLQYAAGFSAVSFDQLGVSLGKLGKNIAEASDGNKSAVASFASLGIAFENADGSLRGVNDVLFDLADRFAAMPDGAKKIQLAMDLMGKSGAAMIPVLNQGSAGLKLLGEEAVRAGVVISTKTAKAAAEFNDSLDRLKAGVKGQAVQLMSVLAPAMARIGRGAVVVSLNLQNMQAISAEVWDRMLQMAEGFAVGLAAVAADIPHAFILAFQKILHAAATTFSAVPGSIGEKLLAPLTAADEAMAASVGEGTAAFETGMSNAKWLITDAMRPLETIIQPINNASAALGDMGEAAETAAGGGGKGGGGVSELAKRLDELKASAESVFEETRTPLEQYNTKLAELGTLLNTAVDGKTLISLDTFNRGVVQAKKDLEDAADTGDSAFENMGDNFKTVLADLLQGTATIKDAFSSLLAQISSDLITSGISKAFAGMLGPTTGGTGILGKILGYAGGTQFARGGLSLVGERGPELVSLPRGSKVTPNASMGGNVFTFAPVIDARGADSAAVARAMTAQAAQFEDFKRSMPDRVAHIRRDPRYKG
jgi:hypothetical protein